MTREFALRANWVVLKARFAATAQTRSGEVSPEPPLSCDLILRPPTFAQRTCEVPADDH